MIGKYLYLSFILLSRIFSKIKQTKNKKIFNGFDRKKVNFNFSLHKFKEAKNNDNSSFEEENNSSFKLPNLNQNKSQQYEELEFLKKMIFTPDFLSQHARNILKFEKQQKKEKKRYINLNTKKFKNNKNIDNYENKYEESKPNDATGNFLFRNNETNLTKSQKKYFDKTKTNLKIYWPENTTNAQKFQTILNSTSSKLIKDVKSLNKINSKENIYDNEHYQKIATNINIDTSNICKKCKRIRKDYNSPFVEIPESFPGITLLKFGLEKRKQNLKKVKLHNKKSHIKYEKNKENAKLSYKQIVMGKIKQTIKNNILRNARKVVYPFYQNYSKYA